MEAWEQGELMLQDSVQMQHKTDDPSLKTQAGKENSPLHQILFYLGL